MTPNETIKLMLHALNNGETEQAYKVAENYASKLSYSGDAYRMIKQQIARKPAKMVMLSQLPSTVKNLLTTVDLIDERVYMPDEIKTVIDDLLTEWEHVDLLKGHNLPVRTKILLHGVTGNGKTTTARHIAKMSGLPFVEVNSDLMVNSHLGSTSANIHNVFKSLQEKCVLFWDEVDTIGKTRGRGDSAAGVENERMVNSMLINMEKLSHNIIFIGATNRMDVLDPAFLRRFDVKIELPTPNEEQKQDFARMLCGMFNVPMVELWRIENSDSLSGVKQLVIDYARNYVLNLLK